MKMIFAIVSLALACQCLASIIPQPGVNAYQMPGGMVHSNPMYGLHTGRFDVGQGHVHPNPMNHINTGSVDMTKNQVHPNPMVYANTAPMAASNFGVARATANLEGNHECTPWWGSYTFWGWTRLTFHCYGAKTCDISIAAGITGKERFQVEPGQLKTIERQWAGGLYQVCNVGYSAFSVVTN